MKVELSQSFWEGRAPEKHFTATVRLDGVGWIRPTVAGVCSALEEMMKNGVPQHAQPQISWPVLSAFWVEEVKST